MYLFRYLGSSLPKGTHRHILLKDLLGTFVFVFCAGSSVCHLPRWSFVPLSALCPGVAILFWSMGGTSRKAEPGERGMGYVLRPPLESHPHPVLFLALAPFHVSPCSCAAAHIPGLQLPPGQVTLLVPQAYGIPVVGVPGAQPPAPVVPFNPSLH